MAANEEAIKAGHKAMNSNSPAKNRNPWIDDHVITTIAEYDRWLHKEHRKEEAKEEVKQTLTYYLSLYYSEVDFKKYSNVKTYGKETALHAAAKLFEAIESGNEEAKSLLTARFISKISNVNFYHIVRGCTPLHAAVEAGDLEIVQILIAKGANVNLINSNGETPLHIAAKRRHKAIVEYLLVRQASPAIYDDAGQLPIDIALAQKQQDFVDFFMNLINKISGGSKKFMARNKLFHLLNTKDLITEISLRDHQIDSYYARHLSKSFNKNNSLIKIDLSHNTIRNKGAKFIAELIEHCPSLAYLDLSFNEIGDKGLNAIVKSLQNNQALTYLNLSQNNIGLEGIRDLVKIFQQPNCHLEQLDLGGNRIDDKAVSILADVLQNNRTLKSLNLSSGIYSTNALTFESAEALGRMLRLNQTLIKLNLSNNRIEARGVEILAEALRTNQFLQQLDLSDNQIDDQGAITLAHAMQDLCVLTELYLQENDIEDTGVQAFTEMLKKNHSLNKLLINDVRNHYHKLIDKSLEDKFNINRILPQIDLSDYKDNLTYVKPLNNALNALRKSSRLSVYNLRDEQYVQIIKETLQDYINLYQQFLAAAKDNDVNRVSKLLSKGVSPCAMPEGEENMAIHLATQNGHVEVVKLLTQAMMQRNVTPAITNKQLKSALELAMLNNHVEIVEIMQQSEKLFHQNLTQKALVFALDRALDKSKEKPFIDIAPKSRLVEETANQGHQEIALKYGIWLATNKESQEFSEEKCVHFLVLATKGNNADFAKKAFEQLSTLGVLDIARKLVAMDANAPALVDEANKSLVIAYHLQQADQNFIDKIFLKAIQHYDAALELDISNIYALVRKGMALEEVNRLEEAKQAYQAAVMIEDKNAEKYLNQAKQKLEEIERQLTLQQSEATPSISSQDVDREELLGKATIPFSQNPARHQFNQKTLPQQTNINVSASQKNLSKETRNLTWRK